MIGAGDSREARQFIPRFLSLLALASQIDTGEMENHFLISWMNMFFQRTLIPPPL